jgi:hypothetical protein
MVLPINLILRMCASNVALSESENCAVIIVLVFFVWNDTLTFVLLNNFVAILMQSPCPRSLHEDDALSFICLFVVRFTFIYYFVV